MFKNVIVYWFDNEENNFNNINQQLLKNEKLCFDDISNSSQLESAGFSKIVDDKRVIESDNRILLKAVFASKKLDKKVIDSVLDERLEKVKKEKKIENVSEEIIDIYKHQVECEYLHFATVVKKEIYILIDKKSCFIYVSASTTNLAEASLNLLRKLTEKLVCINVRNHTVKNHLISFLSDKSPDLPLELYISDYPKVTAKRNNDVSFKSTGMCRDDYSFRNVISSLTIESIDMFLMKQKEKKVIVAYDDDHPKGLDILKDENNDILAAFVLCIKADDVLIFKNFKYDYCIDIYEKNTETYYMSKMTFVGNYMSKILYLLKNF